MFAAMTHARTIDPAHRTSLATRLFGAVLVLFVAALPLSAARAGGTPAPASVSILSGWRADDGTHIAGIRVTLEPGWKTYWRSPGQAGLPPRFDWAGSDNVKAVEVRWPRPKIDRRNGLMTIGYVDEVVFPLVVHPERPGQDVRLAVKMDFGVCEEICVPTTVRLSARLPARATDHDPRISAALAAQPVMSDVRPRCRISPIEGGLHMTLDVPEDRRVGPIELAVLELGDPSLWISSMDVTEAGGRLLAAADVYGSHEGPIVVDRSMVRLTLFGDDVVEFLGCAAGS
ncbi:MAG: hypothetical protein D6688_11430 [Alphaproteobacteria bacterium]|nr:MAG: hypothetical protein D6688_11430 [Alphaproteobacteria bacterium]